MNSNYQKFLPIGSVVLLKGATKRLMITGFCTMAVDDKSKMYDYSGCLFPEGVISSNETALFNHDQIERIFCIGFKDEEQERFMTRLKDLLEKNPSALGEAANNNNVSQNDNASSASDVPPIGPGLN